jgi:RNA polymerase sigma factor (sigma-70 family)
VKYVAGRVGVGLPPNIEQADLVSYGIFGLIDAIQKFDLERAIKFETYAISRIKGAIIDELRSIDWIPRSVRYKAREVEKAYAALEARLHRTPDRGRGRRRARHRPRGPPHDLQPGQLRQRRRARRAAHLRRREGRQALARRHPRGHQGRGPVQAFESRRRSTCSRRRSTRCPSARRSS